VEPSGLTDVGLVQELLYVPDLEVQHPSGASVSRIEATHFFAGENCYFLFGGKEGPNGTLYFHGAARRTKEGSYDPDSAIVVGQKAWSSAFRDFVVTAIQAQGEPNTERVASLLVGGYRGRDVSCKNIDIDQVKPATNPVATPCLAFRCRAGPHGQPEVAVVSKSSQPAQAPENRKPLTVTACSCCLLQLPVHV